jgi:hypothetical protein
MDQVFVTTQRQWRRPRLTLEQLVLADLSSPRKVKVILPARAAYSHSASVGSRNGGEVGQVRQHKPRRRRASVSNCAACSVGSEPSHRSSGHGSSFARS